jgi:hypothetical protein
MLLYRVLKIKLLKIGLYTIAMLYPLKTNYPDKRCYLTMHVFYSSRNYQFTYAIRLYVLSIYAVSCKLQENHHVIDIKLEWLLHRLAGSNFKLPIQVFAQLIHTFQHAFNVISTHFQHVLIKFFYFFYLNKIFNPMEDEKKTLKYYLNHKNFSKISQKKDKKKGESISVVNDQIVFNSVTPESFDDNEIITSYTYMNKKGKGNRKRWNEKENILFYKSLECCGCDFSMMNILFPDRSRSNLKEKYKKEFKKNSSQIEKSIEKYKKFNLERFNELKREISISN